MRDFWSVIAAPQQWSSIAVAALVAGVVALAALNCVQLARIADIRDTTKAPDLAATTASAPAASGPDEPRHSASVPPSLAPRLESTEVLECYQRQSSRPPRSTDDGATPPARVQLLCRVASAMGDAGRGMGPR